MSALDTDCTSGTGKIHAFTLNFTEIGSGRCSLYTSAPCHVRAAYLRFSIAFVTCIECAPGGSARILYDNNIRIEILPLNAFCSNGRTSSSSTQTSSLVTIDYEILQGYLPVLATIQHACQLEIGRLRGVIWYDSFNLNAHYYNHRLCSIATQ